MYIHTHKGANFILLQIRNDSTKHLQSLYFISIGDLPSWENAVQSMDKTYFKCYLGHT